MNVNTGNIIASVIAGVAVLTAGGSLKFAFDTQAQFGELKTQVTVMKEQLTALKADDDGERSQDRQLSRQWTIVSIHKDWINDLRVNQGKSIMSWPPSNRGE